MRSLLGCCLMLAVPAARADISASFANAGPVDSGTFRTAANPAGNDTITLDYTIDGAGAVSLDASTTNTNATFINLVNQFDRPGGTAGSTPNSGAFNTSFSLKIIPVRAGSTTPRLSITTLNGGGLGVEGQNSNRVDGRTLATPAPQMLHVGLTAPAGISLRFKSWSWVAGGGADMRFSNGTNSQDFINVATSGTANFNLVSNPLSLGNGGTLGFGETPDSTSGAGLRGFTFEVLGTAATDNDVVVSFSNSGSGFGPTPPYISSGNSTATITLGFSINGAGIISLDASTTLPGSIFGNMVQEWDQANVGSVANPDLFGKSFTLTGIPSSGNLNITELGGGGIGIQGENPNRIDGLNYGPDNATSTPETLFWVLSAPPGLALNFKNWSYVEGSGGDMRVSNGTTHSDFRNLSGAAGTLALDPVQLGNGDYLTFGEIPGIGSTSGAGIAGFNFAVVSLFTPPATGGILLCERWNDTTFYSTSELVGDSRFYGSPDICRHDNPISSSSLYQGRYYSTRSRGWITAPETGNYRFWISGSNAVQLLLSEDNTKYTKRLIAELNPEIGTGHGITSDSINLWDNYASQMSEEIQLTAGQSYYLETLQTVGHTTVKGHASIAWARPGMARTPLDPTCVQPHALTADDADDDYLPDAWETQYGLDPADNGLTDIARQGERGDFDGDGLSNREEYLLGTNPANSDSDEDGISDFEEIHTYSTDPLVPAPPREQLLATIPLDSHIHASGNWRSVDGGILSDLFRGSISWQFDVPTAGNWILQAATTLRGTVFDSETVNFKVTIDGRPLGDHPVHYGSNHQSLLRIITPHLTAGTHTLEIHIDNLFARRQVRIDSLQLLQPDGPDQNTDGMIDWIAAWLGERDHVAAHPASSATSPFFIEGKSIVPAEVRVNGQPAIPGTDRSHWFANLPLGDSAATPYQIQFPGGTTSSSEVSWSSTNVLTGGATTLRAGDSLKLGAWVGDGSGQATITVTAPPTDAAVLGTVSSSTDAASGARSLRLLGNTNNALRITDADTFDGTSKLTLSLWVKPDAGSLDASARGILSKRVASQNQTAFSLFHWQNGQLFLDLDDGTTSVRHATGHTLGTDWQFIAVVFDGDLPAAQRVKILVNGQLVATCSHPADRIRNLASDLTIGTMNADYAANGLPVSFAGLIDDVRIDRDALTSAQLETIRGTGSMDASSPALVARYDFEQSATPGRDSAVEPATFPVTGTDAIAYPFARKRTYTVTANHTTGGTQTLTVHARHAVMPATVTALQNTLRYLDFDAAAVDPALVLQPGANLRLGLRETLPDDRFRHSLYPETGGPLGIAARLSTDGPIVGIASIQSITLTDVLQNGVSPAFNSTDFPGYYVVYAPIVVTDLPPGATVKITIFRSGVTFLDGSKVKTFSAADFNEGVLLLALLYDTDISGGYCHYIDIYDATGTFIGRR